MESNGKHLNKEPNPEKSKPEIFKKLKLENLKEKLKELKSGNINKKSTKVIIGIVMLFIIIALLAFLIANHYLGKINRERLGDIISAKNETFDADGEGGMDPDDITWGKIKALNDDDLINILLVGQDRLPGEGRQRSDSMILCSINPKTKEVSLVSFLRDLYVQLPGDYSDNRLNAPYAFGGFELLKETLKLNFGITVDGCFEVDFGGFEDVIEILGGIDLELTSAEANLINQIVGGSLKAGMNHLNGAQALYYARIRALDSDFGRTERQRNVLTSVFKSLKGSSLKELNALADEILPSVTTDMSNKEIMSIIAHCYKVLNSDMKTYHVPEEGAYYNAMIRGMSVLVPDLPLIRDQLETYLPLK